jgi:hypothetical protein
MNENNAVAGMSPHEIAFEVQRGGRFVIYQYCVSLLVITLRRNSPVKFVRAGESAVTAGLPFTLLSLVAGWWGIPFGLIYTPQVIYKNLNGGIDVTNAVMNRMTQSAAAPPSARVAI